MADVGPRCSSCGKFFRVCLCVAQLVTLAPPVYVVNPPFDRFNTDPKTAENPDAPEPIGASRAVFTMTSSSTATEVTMAPFADERGTAGHVFVQVRPRG